LTANEEPGHAAGGLKLDTALYAGWVALVITGIVGGLGFAFQQPWLFPSFGPTIYVHTITPKSDAALPWNTFVGHAIGAAAAFLSLAIFGGLDQQTSAACRAASGFHSASVGPVVRFSDRFLMDARTVTGTYPQSHMKGATGTMLCLYNRRTKRAEVQEMAPAMEPVAATDIKDIWWHGTAIAGRPVGSSPVTLMFGSNGKIGGKSACNNYSANYMLTRSELRVYAGMIGTRMAYPANVTAQETQFREVLAAATSAKLQSDGTLMIAAPNGQSLRFARAPENAN